MLGGGAIRLNISIIGCERIQIISGIGSCINSNRSLGGEIGNRRFRNHEIPGICKSDLRPREIGGIALYVRGHQTGWCVATGSGLESDIVEIAVAATSRGEQEADIDARMITYFGNDYVIFSPSRVDVAIAENLAVGAVRPIGSVERVLQAHPFIHGSRGGQIMEPPEVDIQSGGTHR